ncbi:MAG: hypothetical protein U9R34_02040 [Nanoarchaeota archaeon]|nr:hypothetical protein [Nanoarchaeota archaeon]
MEYYSPVGHSDTATMGVASGTFYLDCRGDSYFSDDENISRRMTYVVRKPKSKLCDLIHKK